MNCQHDSCRSLPEGLRAFVVISMTGALAALTVRFSHRVSVAVAAACLGAAEAAFANIYWDVASDYYTHTVAGLLLCAAGNEMLNDGSPLQIKWWKGCIGSGTFTILFFALVFGFARRSGSTFNIGHRLVYFGLAVLLGAFGHVDCLRKIRQLRSRATAHSDENEKDAAGESDCCDRPLFDAGCYLLIGLVFIGHQHDKRPLAIFMHTALGFSLVILGVAICAADCIFAHVGRNAACASRVRSFLCFSHLVPALILLFLGSCIRMFRDSRNGLLLVGDGPGQAEYFEVGCLYLGLLIWLAAAITAVKAARTQALPRGDPARCCPIAEAKDYVPV